MKATQHCMSPLAQRFSAAGLLRFAAPSIGMMLVIAIYTVTDGIFIGRFAGAEALAASNIVYPAINLLLGLAIMLASGGSALVAGKLGEGKPREARRDFSLLTAAGFALGTLYTLLALALFTPLLHFLGAGSEGSTLYAAAASYLSGFLPFFPFAVLMLIFNAFYIADGRPLVGFLVSVASGVTNAGLDALFLAVFDMGVGGASLATGLSYLTAALIGLFYFSRRARTLAFARPRLRLRVLARASYNGLAEMVTQLSIGVTTFLFNLMTFAYMGEDGVAAISVILYAEMLLTSLLLGFTNGVAPIFSYHYGARHGGELLRLLRLALASIGAFGILVFTLSQLLGAPLIALFLPGGGHVAALTQDGFALFSLSFLICGFNIFTAGFFTALSNGRISALCSLLRNLVGIALFLLALPHFLGVRGIWLAVPASDAAALLFSLACLKSEADAILSRCRRRFPRLFTRLHEGPAET